MLVLKTKDAEARSVADFNVADVLDSNGSPVIAGDDYFTVFFRGFDETETSHVIKLAALGIESATGIGVVCLESDYHLNDWDMEVIEAAGIEKNVILHGGAAEAGVVGNARNRLEEHTSELK